MMKQWRGLMAKIPTLRARAFIETEVQSTPYDLSCWRDVKTLTPPPSLFKRCNNGKIILIHRTRKKQCISHFHKQQKETSASKYTKYDSKIDYFATVVYRGYIVFAFSVCVWVCVCVNFFSSMISQELQCLGFWNLVQSSGMTSCTVY